MAWLGFPEGPAPKHDLVTRGPPLRGARCFENAMQSVRDGYELLHRPRHRQENARPQRHGSALLRSENITLARTKDFCQHSSKILGLLSELDRSRRSAT